MYIPLYVKSNFSLLSSMLRLEDIIKFNVSKNNPYCTINDTNMFMTMKLVKMCQENNLKPIISISLSYEEKEFVLFAKTYKGYQSLIKLSTISSKEKLSINNLRDNNQDVICVLPYKSREILNKIQEIYNEIYLGYSNLREEKDVKKITSNIVFFKEALYMNANDKELLKYLYLIRDGKTIMDDTSYDLDNHELNITSPLSYSDNEGLMNTYKIAEKCNVEFPQPELLLPIYKDTKGMSPSKYLFELAKAGLNKRLDGNITEEYQKRLLYELNVIDKMGFSNYFLVVYDFIKYSKKNDILVGPGRGSAAGSLTSYALGITEIDPLKYNLLFERFLNPERKTMPDIDTDFPDDKRDQVIKYVIDKYGEKNVSGIVTFGTLGAKQVIRDVSRVLNIPTYKVDNLSRIIPGFTKDTLKEIYQKNETFKVRVESDSTLSRMFKIALKLEGFPRHTSSHAAGILMSEKPFDTVIPLTFSDDMYLSGYSMEYLEELGLLKMDFLGLKNLTIIHNILKDIEKNHNTKIEFNNIPLNDQKSLEIFANADTEGIFQFESSGMKKFLLKLKPSSFEDIFAAIALFRPGPAQNIDSYIRRKHGQEKITYLDPCLEDILKNTYGIIIYQEQIIQVANVFAGYSLGEADVLRRAMSKKKVDLLKNEEQKFIEKSLKNHRSLETAKKMFQLILNFAGYGFNRSHSVAYSLIAYKMAYLKVHYKNEFFANLLTNMIGSEIKTKEYIEEAKSKEIIIEKPDINKSTDKYIVSDNKIIYPFSNLKSVGNIAAKKIMEARGDTPFVDIYDAFSRLLINGVGKKNIECLVLGDCFRIFNYNKKTIIDNMDNLINYAELTKDLDPSLVMKPEIVIKEEYNKEELLEQEKNIFGFYFSHHPTTTYYKAYPRAIRLNKLKDYFDKRIEVLVLVERVKVIDTKKGDRMAFVTGSDETSTIDFTFFPNIYKIYSDVSKGDILKINGRVEKRFDEWQMAVNKVERLNGEINEKN